MLWNYPITDVRGRARRSRNQTAWTSYCTVDSRVDSTVMLVDFDHVSDKVFFQDTHVVTIITTEHWLFFSDNILPADVQQGGGREARWTLITLSQALLRQLCGRRLVRFSHVNLQPGFRFEGLLTLITLVRCTHGWGGWWSTGLGSLMAGSPLTIPLPPGRPTAAAATLARGASRSRWREEGILWMT